MLTALGRSDEVALATLRRLQRRYSGLTYRSPSRDDEIVFEPVLEVDSDTVGVTFDYAIMDRSPDGCRSGFVLPDLTVWFRLLDVDVRTFPSLDHFIECDALLHDLGHQRPAAVETPPDANAYLEGLRERHPQLRRMTAQSGFCIEWWGDDHRLVYFNGLDAQLWAGNGDGSVPTVVRTWLVDGST
ncbi:hypothetical protein AB0J72_26145 [Dactylosporangium sp. NPDC049742]|uniref:hypothetical protein n=1 Tax=Dactylosporangium sp. NPDC049742 TaxID=3154737 RepID=UPI003420F31F